MSYPLLVDTSLWNDDDSTPIKMDWQRAAAAGIDGAIVKASQATYADPDFHDNYRAARGVVLRSTYHFLVWDVAAVQQARFYHGLIKNDWPDLMPMVDYEWWNVVPAGAIVTLRVFLEEMCQLAGHNRFGIYTAPGFWRQYGSKDAWWAQFALWTAQYREGAPDVYAPWARWTFHQYTSRGDGLKYGAESAAIDINRFNGTREELYALAGQSPPVSTEPEPTAVGLRMTVTAGTLNVRSGPGIRYPVVGSLGYGQQVEALDVGGADAWVNTGAGWVSVRWLQVG